MSQGVEKSYWNEQVTEKWNEREADYSILENNMILFSFPKKKGVQQLNLINSNVGQIHI